MPAPADKQPLIRLLVFGLAVVLYPGVVPGSERERQLAERLSENVTSGEPVWLQAGAEKFLGLHNAALGALPRQAVLLVHNMGGHPDWPEVIAPLRADLPDYGWSTLSLQMPLLAPRALADDYGRTVVSAGRRIRAGIEFLREQGYSSIVVLGYGFGASQALASLAGDKNVDGLVMVSILAREFLQPALDLPSLLAKLEIPVLDIYARNDFPEVADNAPARRLAMSGSGAAVMTQRIIPGTDHYYTAQEQRLVEVVAGWLQKTFADTSTTAYDGPDSRRTDDGALDHSPD